MSRPTIGRLVVLEVAEGVHGIGEAEFGVLQAQGVRTQSDHVRQPGDQCGGSDFKVRFDPG